MNHDIPDLKKNLRLALADTDNGPSAEHLTQAPLLDHWFGVSQSAFPSLCGQIKKANAPVDSRPSWSKTSIIVGLDRECQWVRTLNRFYRLSNHPCPSIPEFEHGFGKLVLQDLQAVSIDEFTKLVDAFATRARWYLGQIN